MLKLLLLWIAHTTHPANLYDPMAAATATADSVSSQAYLEGNAVKETRVLISELCRHFYSLGWVSGTGGSITIKVHDDSISKPHQLILMSPSGPFPLLIFFFSFTSIPLPYVNSPFSFLVTLVVIG